MKRLTAIATMAGAFFCAAVPAAAQTWDGVVVGQSGQSTPRAFADSFRVAEALKLGGIEKVALLRDKPRSEVLAALQDLAGSERAVIYLAGPLLPSGNGLDLPGGPLMFEDIFAQVQQAQLQDVALLIEACPAQGILLNFPSPPDGIATLRAASAGPDAACADTPRMTEQLITAVDRPTTLNELLSEVWVSSDLTTPLTLRPAAAPTSPLSPVVSPVVSIVQSSTVTLAPVTANSTEVAAVTRVALQQPASRPAAGEVVIFAPPPQSQIAAQPAVAGLPKPSIIVGLIRPADEAVFEQVSAPGDVQSTEISFESLDARQALRAQDPEQFAQLVATGAFDPPEQLLAVALQTELTRMKCYTSTIDGIWGRGSRSSIERYFSEIDGADPVSLEPTTDLFRQIITQDDIDCPVLAAAPAARQTTTTRARATTTRRTTTRAAAPKPRAAPKPAAKKPARTISTSNSLGVFR